MQKHIEWSNFWWEAVGEDSVERWLLAGDSIARQCRDDLNREAGENVAIDFIGSSGYIDDLKLKRELDLFLSLSPIRYSKGIINFSFHHGFHRTVLENIEKYKFEKEYVSIIQRCMEQCDEIIMISGTPHVIKDHLEQEDQEINNEIEARNSILKKICSDMAIRYIDLWGAVRHNGLIKHSDNIHFTKESNVVIANIICNSIKNDVKEIKKGDLEN